MHHQRRPGSKLSNSAAYSPGDPRLQPAGFEDYVAVVDAPQSDTQHTIVTSEYAPVGAYPTENGSPCRITATRRCASASYKRLLPHVRRSPELDQTAEQVPGSLWRIGGTMPAWPRRDSVSAPLLDIAPGGLTAHWEVISELHSANRMDISIWFPGFARSLT